MHLTILIELLRTAGSCKSFPHYHYSLCERAGSHDAAEGRIAQSSGHRAHGRNGDLTPHGGHGSRRGDVIYVRRPIDFGGSLKKL